MASPYGYGQPQDDGEHGNPYEYYPSQGYPTSNDGHHSIPIDHAAVQPPSLTSGHAPQLSESFYSEAAAALQGPVAPAASSLGHSPFSDSNAPAAHLPTLLRSPYDGSVPGVEQQGAGGSTPSSPTKSAASPYYEEKQLGGVVADGGYSYGYGRGEAQYAGVGADDSPRSSLAYDDKTELEHTPGNPFASVTPTMDHPYLTPQQYGAVGDADDEETTLNAQERYSAPYVYGQDEGGYEGAELRDEGYGHGPDGTYGGSGFEQEVVLDTQHFGPAPPKGALLRRHKTKKQVKLTQGNLVLDCPVPTKLLSFLSRRGNEEFESMRYTAATCDPDDFAKSHFTVRPAMYSRHTEIFICITLYNEDEVLFTRTLHGVMKNIAHLCSRHKSRTWGPEGWKKVVVAIVADGRKKVHPRVLDCLAALGVYQEGVAKNVVNGKVVQAHIYEYTTQLSIDSNLQFKGAERGLVPMQIIFCLKEHNAKKINSHRWFFNAFSPVLQPNVCVLIDAGTRPENKSIYYLWKAFDLHSNVAGACGEICADTKGKWGIGKALLNPLIAAQNFEYKISNILDKTTESVFGYITVLPGAFSAYRYLALQNDDLGRGPLASYFKGEKLMGADADVFTSNMYLAEDRILCFELAAKRGEDWVLRYVRRARGVTDVPESLPDLIAQRRRWLNGSFFAAVYSLWHFRQFFATGHTTFRKVLFGVETAYQLLNMLFAWFSISLWGLFFVILTRSLESPTFHLGKGISWLNDTLALIYFGTVISCFVFALGNRPATSKFKFIAVAVIFAVLTVYMMIASILCIVKIVGQAHDAIYAQMCIALLSTFGTYVISALIALDPLFLVTSFPAYILMAPSWINILNTYAFANLHDFTWGNRPEEPEVQDLGTVKSTGQGTVVVDLPTAQQDVDASYDVALDNLRRRPMIIRGDISFEEKMKLKEDYYKSVRSNVLLVWLLSNGLLAALIMGGDSTSAFDPGSGTTRQKVFMLTILIFMAATSLLRLIASTIYEVWRWIAGS